MCQYTFTTFHKEHAMLYKRVLLVCFPKNFYCQTNSEIFMQPMQTTFQARKIVTFIIIYWEFKSMQSLVIVQFSLEKIPINYHRSHSKIQLCWKIKLEKGLGNTSHSQVISCRMRTLISNGTSKRSQTVKINTSLWTFKGSTMYKTTFKVSIVV